MYLFDPSPNEDYAPYVVYDGVLTLNECDSLKKMAADFLPGEISGRPEGRSTSDYRQCECAAIEWRDSHQWLFERVASVTDKCNREHYQFDVVGFLDEFTMLRYPLGGHYTWHSDYGGGICSLRKLTVIVVVSDRSEYDGGQLALQDGSGQDQKIVPPAGSVVVFPSFVLHRVLPVTRGTRYVVAAWAYGPPFR